MTSPLVRLAAALALGAILLALPAKRPPVPPAPPGATPFEWNQDSLWRALEARFVAVRTSGCVDAPAEMALGFTAVGSLLDTLAINDVASSDPRLETLESAFFALGPVVAACPDGLREYVDLSGRLRAVIKDQSQHWDANDLPSRQRVYRLLYGTRAAVEEAMLQHPDSSLPAPHGPRRTVRHPIRRGARGPDSFGGHACLPRRVPHLRTDRTR